MALNTYVLHCTQIDPTGEHHVLGHQVVCVGWATARRVLSDKSFAHVRRGRWTYIARTRDTHVVQDPQVGTIIRYVMVKEEK